MSCSLLASTVENACFQDTSIIGNVASGLGPLSVSSESYTNACAGKSPVKGDKMT